MAGRDLSETFSFIILWAPWTCTRVQSSISGEFPLPACHHLWILLQQLQLKLAVPAPLALMLPAFSLYILLLIPPTSSSRSCRLSAGTVGSIKHLCLFIIKCEALQEYWPILVLSYESIPLLFIKFLPERLVKEKTRISDLVNVCTSVVLLCKNIIREDVSSMMVLSNGVNNPCSGVSCVNAHLTLKHKICVGAVVMTAWKPQSLVMARGK